jgi:ATP-dependent Zn protease
MEKVKRKYKGDNYSVEELSKFRKKLLDIQEKMQKDFDEKVTKLLKAKYEKAKKILEAEKKKTQDYIKEQLDNVHTTIDKEFQAAQLEKAKRLQEMDELIASKSEEVSNIDERIKQFV